MPETQTQTQTQTQTFQSWGEFLLEFPLLAQRLLTLSIVAHVGQGNATSIRYSGTETDGKGTVTIAYPYRKHVSPHYFNVKKGIIHAFKRRQDMRLPTTAKDASGATYQYIGELLLKPD